MNLSTAREWPVVASHSALSSSGSTRSVTESPMNTIRGGGASARLRARSGKLFSRSRSLDTGTIASRVPISIRTSAATNINAMRSVRPGSVILELEVDELIGLARVEEPYHQREIDVPGTLHEPWNAENPPNPPFRVGQPLDREEDARIEHDHDQAGLGKSRDAPLVDQHVEGGNYRPEALGPEKQPSEAGQVEHDNHLHHPEQRLRRPLSLADSGEPVGAQDRAVVKAPGQEGPVCAVPETAEQHRDDEAPVLHKPPAPVAAERDVQIVA